MRLGPPHGPGRAPWTLRREDPRGVAWRGSAGLGRLRKRRMKAFIECEDRELRRKAEGGGCRLCSRGGMRKRGSPVSNLLEAGSSRIQPAWESNNNNNDSRERGGGELGRGTRSGWVDGWSSGFSLPEPTVRPGSRESRRSGRECSSLRWWDVPDASFGGQPPAGLGRAGPDRGGVGDGDGVGMGMWGTSEGRAALREAASGLPVWPSAWLKTPHTPHPGMRRGLVLGLPPPSPSPFKESSECSECGGLGPP